MLTIFAIPKPFTGRIRTIQLNAIGGWQRLRPPCEVLLFGDEEGVAEAAAQLGTRHIPDVECNEYGTPLVGSAFGLAQKLASHELLCYVNADVILLSDFLSSVAQVPAKPFLLVGRRWNIDLDAALDFSDPSWEQELLARVRSDGKLSVPAALDYFAFTRGLCANMPPFAVGRVGWDNWMVFQARTSGIPVIDATKTITAVHQNHDYSHLPQGEETMRSGLETMHNRELLGGRHRSFDVRDATHVLTASGMRPAKGPRHLLRRLQKSPELNTNFSPLVQVILGCRALVDPVMKKRGAYPFRQKNNKPGK